MKRWKQYLSVMTAAAVVISGPVIPAKQAKADGNRCRFK